MSQEISDFEYQAHFDIPTYYVIQSSSRITSRIEHQILIYHIFLYHQFTLSAGPGIDLLLNQNHTWTIFNTSPAYDLKIMSGSGIKIGQSELTFFIDNTSLATNLTLTAGEGIIVFREDSKRWLIKNCSRGSSIIEPILIAGRSIEIEHIGRHRWKVHYRPKAMSQEPVNRISSPF